MQINLTHCFFSIFQIHPTTTVTLCNEVIQWLQKKKWLLVYPHSFIRIMDPPVMVTSYIYLWSIRRPLQSELIAHRVRAADTIVHNVGYVTYICIHTYMWTYLWLPAVELIKSFTLNWNKLIFRQCCISDGNFNNNSGWLTALVSCVLFTLRSGSHAIDIS